MENQSTQNLAETFIRLLQTEKESVNDSIQLSLEKINQRLDTIESNIAFQSLKSNVQNPKTYHSSQEKFTNLEDLADEIIAGLETEKACPYEPTGKPCDHCAMCSSRGF